MFREKLALLAVLAIVTVAGVANACTAIIVGKKASASGRVIVAHNNDGVGPFTMQYALLPARDHKPGETMLAEPGVAKVPEAPHSAACYWAEVKSGVGKPPPADHFLSERGVLIISNNGGVMNEWDGVAYELPDEGRYSELRDGGIGQSFRRAIAERARSAHEAVAIATNLIETWGYSMPSRLFTIADKDEAWVLEVLRGRRYVARRCPDDEVVVHPNCLTIGKLKPGDVVAPCFATKGADFDFIRSYQGPRTWKSDYNHYRWRGSYITVAGVDVGEPAEYPFSVKPAHPVSADDVKRGLRSHYEGMPWQMPLKHPVDGAKNVVPVCRNGTQQSMVCMFAEDPSDVEIHVAVGRPCERQYVHCRPFAGVLPTGTVTGAAALKRLKDHWLPGP